MNPEFHSISKEELSKVEDNEGKIAFQKRHFTWYARSYHIIWGGREERRKYLNELLK